MPDVIDLKRRLAEDEIPRFTAHWKARAASDPGWAARQIWGLLQRALDAEKDAAELRELVAELRGEG